MPTYLFEAIVPERGLERGSVEADTLGVARQRLLDQGYREIRFLKAFRYSAKGPDGRDVTAEAAAETLDEAKARLEGIGFTSVRFFEDENAEAIKQMVSSGSGIFERGIRMPSPEAMRSSQRRRTLRHKILWAVGRHMVILGPLLTWNVWTLCQPGTISRAGARGLVATPCYVVLMVLQITPMVCYHQILDACVWMDWKRMRRFIRIARTARRFLGMGIPEFELMSREAYALASEGRVADAVAHMERVRATIPLKPHIYFGRLAAVYQHAKLYDKQQACMLEGMKEGPKGATAWIDYGAFLLRRDRDVPGAKAAQAEAAKYTMSELAKAAFRRNAGMIALADRDFPRAHEELKAAVSGLVEHASNPVGEYLLNETRADLAIACARLGRTGDARSIWAGIELLMRARKEDWIIGLYEEAIGTPKGLE